MKYIFNTLCSRNQKDNETNTHIHVMIHFLVWSVVLSNVLIISFVILFFSYIYELLEINKCVIHSDLNCIFTYKYIFINFYLK